VKNTEILSPLQPITSEPHSVSLAKRGRNHIEGSVAKRRNDLDSLRLIFKNADFPEKNRKQ